MKWGEFSALGFGDGAAPPGALQFDLTEGARSQRAAQAAAQGKPGRIVFAEPATGRERRTSGGSGAGAGAQVRAAEQYKSPAPRARRRRHAARADHILARYGKEMTWDIKAGLMGKRTSLFPLLTRPPHRSPCPPAEREAAEHLLSFFPDLPPSFTVEHYLSARRALQDARWPSVQPLPGALRLVRHLHAHGVPLALATCRSCSFRIHPSCFSTLSRPTGSPFP